MPLFPALRKQTQVSQVYIVTLPQKKKKKTDRQIHLHVLAIFIIKVVYFKTHGLSFITGTKRK